MEIPNGPNSSGGSAHWVGFNSEAQLGRPNYTATRVLWATSIAPSRIAPPCGEDGIRAMPPTLKRARHGPPVSGPCPLAGRQAGPSCRFVRYLPRGRDGRQSKCSTAAVGATGHRFRRSGHRRAQRRETNQGDPTTGACVTGWEQVFARGGRRRRARGVLGLRGARGRGKGRRSLAGVRWLHWCPKEGRGGFGLREFGRRPTAALRPWREQEGTRGGVGWSRGCTGGGESKRRRKRARGVLIW